jgi:alpha-N-arabinofuranosidase
MIGNILLFVFACCLESSVLAQLPSATTLKIDTGHITGKVSPTFYGLMTEEINHSYDGGLYPEMVRNRTMHDSTWDLEHWFLVQDGDASASISLDKSTGPSEALNLSLKLAIAKATAESPAGVLNDGFWGMKLGPNTTYKASLYAKADSAFSGAVVIKLVANETGATVASAVIPALTGDWARYEFTLATKNIPASAANHLTVTASHTGTVWLDLVSVMPPTYKDRTNGNRIDLMERLAVMKPTFLRFPGGNYLEGDYIQGRYEWRTTIGPLVDRPTHPSPWKYNSSDGLGLLEFLNWCDDLKMQPVLAVYAGYSMAQQHIQPGPNLEPFVQDALDEIEYVTGGPDTKWGAVRVRDGHAKPFPLTYVEIGNEDNFDSSDTYSARYAQFYRAIKKTHPGLQLIATTPIRGMQPDVLDDHFYKRADEFFRDVHHYDKADRKGPKIFVGEWSSREGSPTPNFGATLGDAAWMTGMERNSDLIVMASYAPLFVNVDPGAMQWDTDLIGYDAEKTYGSPSYYAQVMFANHLGTDILDSSWTGDDTRLFYSVTSDRAQGTIYLKLVNANSTARQVGIQLSGASHIERNAIVTSLKASGTAETNTLGKPENIVPQTHTFQGAGQNFSFVLPAYSIQILDLKVR